VPDDDDNAAAPLVVAAAAAAAPTAAARDDFYPLEPPEASARDVADPPSVLLHLPTVLCDAERTVVLGRPWPPSAPAVEERVQRKAGDKEPQGACSVQPVELGAVELDDYGEARLPFLSTPAPRLAAASQLHLEACMRLAVDTPDVSEHEILQVRASSGQPTAS